MPRTRSTLKRPAGKVAKATTMKSAKVVQSMKAIKKTISKCAVKKKPVTQGSSIQLNRRKKAIVKQILESAASTDSLSSKKKLKKSNDDFAALVKALTAEDINTHIGRSEWLSDLVYNCDHPEWCIPKLELLLRAGLNPDTPGLLHEATYGGGPALRTLLRYGANPVVPDGQSCPFMAAAEEGASPYQSQNYVEWLHEALMNRWETKQITNAEFESQWKKALDRILKMYREEKQPTAWFKPRVNIFKEIHKQRFVVHSIYENCFGYEGQLGGA